MGYINQFLETMRVLRVGEITVANANWQMSDNTPFTLYLLPKTDAYNDVEVLTAQLVEEDAEDAGPCPFNIGGWNAVAIRSIDITVGLLNVYRVFWGGGNGSKVK